MSLNKENGAGFRGDQSSWMLPIDWEESARRLHDSRTDLPRFCQEETMVLFGRKRYDRGRLGGLITARFFVPREPADVIGSRT